MNKFEAIQAMMDGKKVRHRHFDKDEWVTIRNGSYVFEDGVRCSPALFWDDRQDSSFLDDWEIVQPSASIYFFHGANCEHEEMTGYKHNQKVPIQDIFSITAFIFGMGLNVMLYHSGDNIIIFVDDKRFQQR